MYEDLFPPLILLLFLIFTFVVPFGLYKGFRKIRAPVPFWLPVVPAVIIIAVDAVLGELGILSQFHTMAGTLMVFSFMLLLTTLAVITPYLWLGKKTGIDRPWASFTLLALVGYFMMFWSTMGESREGGPLPLFTPLLPLTGWIFDVAAAVLHIQDIVYSPAFPVHTILQLTGLYLEVLILSTMFWFLMSLLPPAKNE